MTLIKKINRQPLLTALLAASLFSTAAVAETHSAHEHGVARLTIAVSSTGVEVELETPAANIFGFEHAPSSENDDAALRNGMTVLQGGSKLFTVNSEAECSQDNVALNLSDIYEQEKEEDEDDKSEIQTESDTHSDVGVTWKFKCDEVDEIEHIEVKLFSAFTNGFDDIDVEWISASQSGKAELENNGIVHLK